MGGCNSKQRVSGNNIQANVNKSGGINPKSFGSQRTVYIPSSWQPYHGNIVGDINDLEL